SGGGPAILEARALADELAAGGAAPGALRACEARRPGPTARVVRTNREHPPDYLIRVVEELVGDKPFDDLGRHISPDELRQLSDDYKRVAGFALEDVPARAVAQRKK